MLTTNRQSRLRLFTGAAAVALTTLTGLGFTASGSQAAERIREHVGKTLNVKLVSPVAAMAAMQAAPAAPEAPGALPAPPAPPAPPAVAGNRDVQTTTTSTTSNGKTVKRTVILRHEGDADVDVDAEVKAAMADVPEVSSRNCVGDKNEIVVNEKQGRKQRIIICTNRIERLAAEGAKASASVDTVEIERHAMHSALEGVRSARARILADRSLSEASRREALAGIDEAIAELESESK